MNLGDLRRLVARLEGQEDTVPVHLAIAVPGLAVNTGNFPTGTDWSPVTMRATATRWSIGQTSGYHPGFGPASHVLIEGSP